MNKDGNLDLDEFIIAMHLIELAKSGQSIPTTLPPELIPATKKFVADADPQMGEIMPEGSKGRSESVSSVGKPEPGKQKKVFLMFYSHFNHLLYFCVTFLGLEDRRFSCVFQSRLKTNGS